jgi:trehalose/maltose transport system substrate-binding protein
VFQGKSYEGLTCNALEWVASQNGGSFIDAQGNITINNPQAAQALNMAAGWIGKITPKGTLGYMEEESRAVFQNGDALFMRNWPYAYVLAQDSSSAIRGKVGVMPLPKGADGHSVSALGGWQWAINGYTKHPEAAIALLKIVSDAESQKRALALLGQAPSRTALYDDPQVLAQAPYLADFKGIFAQAMPRPGHSNQTAIRAGFPEPSTTPPLTYCAVTVTVSPPWRIYSSDWNGSKPEDGAESSPH